MEKKRYASIDQFRGFTMLLMMLANVRINLMPDTFNHVNALSGGGFSVADAVLPFFLFISGMGFRVSFMRIDPSETARALWSAFVRHSILILVGVVFVYHFKLSRIFWEALTLIGLSGILVLPVIGKNTYVRIIFAFCCMLLFQIMLSLQFETILGTQSGAGVFEPLVFVFVFLMGTLVADWLPKGKSILAKNTLLWGTFLGCAGWMLSPWLPIGQKGIVHITYGFLYSGIAFITFFVFYYIIDVWDVHIPHFSVLGRNALIVYALHYIVEKDINGLIPSTAGLALSTVKFLVVYEACYIVARYLHKRKWYITV